MDNKQNRQFYWEVKDFMGKPHSPTAPASKPSDILSSAKNILEQKKTYRQSAYNPNITSLNNISQAIVSGQNANSKGTPNTPAHGKNIDGNAFRSLQETKKFEETTESDKEADITNADIQSAEDAMSKQMTQEVQKVEKQQNANITKAEANKKAAFTKTEAMGMMARAKRQEMMARGREINPNSGKSYDQEREEERTSNAQKHYGKVLSDIAGKDPKNLSAKDSAELLMYKIMSGQTERDPKIYGYGQQSQESKDKAAAIKTRSGIEARQRFDAEKETGADVSQKEARLTSYEEMPVEKVADISRKAWAKANPIKISPFYKTTRGDFYTATGREYDALSRDDVRTFHKLDPETPADYTNLNIDLPQSMQPSNILSLYSKKPKNKTLYGLIPKDTTSLSFVKEGIFDMLANTNEPTTKPRMDLVSKPKPNEISPLIANPTVEPGTSGLVNGKELNVAALSTPPESFSDKTAESNKLVSDSGQIKPATKTPTSEPTMTGKDVTKRVSSLEDKNKIVDLETDVAKARGISTSGIGAEGTRKRTQALVARGEKIKDANLALRAEKQKQKNSLTGSNESMA
jgi:hypothetical protein